MRGDSSHGVSKAVFSSRVRSSHVSCWWIRAITLTVLQVLVSKAMTKVDTVHRFGVFLVEA